MNSSPLVPPGHSAHVQMHLTVNGHVLRIGQLGPDFIVLDDLVNHPPADAEISLSIDGRQSRWRIALVDGISEGQPRARISAISKR
jgi:hypothetical protein